jgi:capsular exopolysaccharide synthesis family protein
MSREYPKLIQPLGIVHESQEPASEPQDSLTADAGGNVAPELRQVPVEEIEIEPTSRIVFQSDPQGLAADRFRFLRMRLRELWDAGKLKRVLITSPLPEDGKSTVSLNLATALAERGRNTVLLLEADLHHPTLLAKLGAKAGPGLAQCLECGSNPLSLLRRIEPLGWYLLPAGDPSASPGGLLHGEVFAKLLQTLSPYFDWILIDSPPVLPLADAPAMLRHVDTSLVVVRAGRTPSDAVDAAIKTLGNKHVLGVILNGMEGVERLYSKYSTYYHRYSRPAGDERKSRPNRQLGNQST